MDNLSKELFDKDKIIRVSNHAEVRRIQRAIEQTINANLNRVKHIDKRLSLRLLKVRSYYDGLKIGLPDEFDFLAELFDLREDEDIIVRPTGFNGTRNLWKTPHGKAGRRKIQYVGKALHDIDSVGERDDAWLKQVGTKSNPEYVMDCISVKNTFYFAVLKVVQALKGEDLLPRYLEFGEEPTFIHGPAVTFEFIWNGRAYKNLKISVDLTICIKVDNWKMCIDSFDWMVEDSCISNTLRDALDNHGYHLTPFISDRGHSCQWRISTSYIEHLLMDSFSYESKVKVGIRCLKYQRDKYIGNLPNANQMFDQNFADVVRFKRFYTGDDEAQQLVSSYMIKTAAFVTLGLLAKKLLNKHPLSVLYKHFIIRLYTSIKFNTLRMFFISDYKLRVPEFGEILPGFKALVDSINEEDVHGDDYILWVNTNMEKYSESEREFMLTNDMFT